MVETAAAERPVRAKGPAVRVDELMGLFDGRIKRVRAGVFYQLGLLLIATAMLILPLIYLALIGLIGYGVALHAVNNLSLFEELQSARAAAVAYLTPLLVGVVVIFFLIKPLLARPGRPIRSRALKLEDEPLLYAFVGKLSEAVHAPRPVRIEVDANANASASLGGGVLGFLGNRLTLRIGLPLMATMNLRQLSGVLAHELGHFSQGGAMRLSWLIHSINNWFARVVYERDAWDEQLQAARGIDLRLRLVVLLIIALVWLSRRVLWVLMQVGHLLSLFMSRQMEYNADWVSARAIGGAACAGALEALPAIMLAEQKSRADLARAWEERRLGDDLPALIADNLQKMPAEVRQTAVAEALAARAGLFSSHPALGARIKRVAREKSEGIFREERPAAVLLSDFAGTCREVSMDQYCAMLGPMVLHTTLVPTSELIGRQEQVVNSFEALERFFLHRLLFTRLLAPRPTELMATPNDPRALVGELTRARAMAQQTRGFCGEAIDRYEEALNEELQLFSRLQLLKAGVPVGRVSVEQAQAELARAVSRQAETDVELAPFDHASGRRLLAALRLLHFPQLEKKLPEARRMLKQSHQILLAVEQLSALREPLVEMLRNHTALVGLLDHVKGREQNERFQTRGQLVMRHLAQAIQSLHSGLSSANYPFEHPNGQVSLAFVAIGVPPPPDDLGALLHGGDEIFDSLKRFYYRAMGTLADHAEQVEAAAGLGPLPSDAAEK